MHIKVHSDTIQSAARVASRACATRTPMDTLSDVKMVVNGKASIYGTNLNLSASCNFDCEVLEPGESCFPAQRFADVLGKLQGIVTIKTDKSAATIQCGADKFRVLTGDPTKHRSEEIVEPGSYHEIKLSSFMKGLKKLVFCTDPSNGRFAYGGIAFSLEKNGTCWFVSSDSKRVSFHTCTGSVEGEHSCALSSTVAALDGIKLVMSAFSPSETETVKISAGVNSMTFHSQGVSIKVPLLEGRFPDLIKEIKPPSSGDAILNVTAAELLNGVRKTLVMSDKESLAAKFVAQEDGSLLIQMDTAEVGQSEVSVFCEGNGESSHVLANASYISQWLATLQPDDLVTLRIPATDGDLYKKAIYFSADSGSYYLVSPMNTR